MNPTSNQMNSIYQSPLGQQPVHRTSIISIIVLLLIAIIVAVLGFGRINNMKEEEARMMQQEQEASRMRTEQMQNQTQTTEQTSDASADVLLELNSMDGDTNDADIKTMESAF